MTGAQVQALVLLLVAGFLIGGVVTFARDRKWIPTVIVAVLAALALGGAVLRVV